MSSTSLFAPGTLGDIVVPNRVVMAPLTRSRADIEDVQTPLAAEYYRQRASAGLLIAEATNISRQGRGYAYTPGIYTDAHVAAWRSVTDAVHEAGGRIVLQLLHVGRMSHVSLQDNGKAPVAPSAIQAGGTVLTQSGMLQPSVPRALRTDEIPVLISDYRRAARNAKNAGFDGVEIHMGNCFLLDQFLRDSTNQRDDSYGGSVENRVRLPVAVAQAVSDIWGAGRVGVRVSPVKAYIGDTPLDSDPQATYGRLVEKLGELGVGYLHAIEGQAPEGALKEPFDFQALRQAFNGQYVANGGYTRESAITTIAQTKADMVAFGKAFIGNPDLVERLRRNLPLVDAAPETYYGGGAKGYTDFPAFATDAA